MRGPLPLMLLALVACDGGDGGDAPPARPKIPVVTGKQVEHASASQGTAFTDARFACCDTAPAAAVVGAYVDLGEALAADDLGEAAEQAGALRAALAGAATEASDDDRARVEQMAALVDRMTGQDIAGVREEYLDLTDPMLAFARAHQGGAAEVAVAFCPMKPGRWLQSEGEIANPYYGAEMLRCGVFEPLPEGG